MALHLSTVEMSGSVSRRFRIAANGPLLIVPATMLLAECINERLLLFVLNEMGRLPVSSDSFQPDVVEDKRPFAMPWCEVFDGK